MTIESCLPPPSKRGIISRAIVRGKLNWLYTTTHKESSVRLLQPLSTGQYRGAGGSVTGIKGVVTWADEPGCLEKPDQSGCISLCSVVMAARTLMTSSDKLMVFISGLNIFGRVET